MKLEKRLTSAAESVTAKALGAMRPRTPTRRCRSISRVNRRPISTGWRLLRNGLANVPSTRRSSRSSNCWSPMVSQRLPVRRAQEGFRGGLTWSTSAQAQAPRRTFGVSAATTVVRSPGRVAELADAQDSGSCVRKDVRVQVPPRPRDRRLEEGPGQRPRFLRLGSRAGRGPLPTLPVVTATTSAGDPASPLISIVLTTHRPNPFFAATLESVRKQTWSDWELLVVDDGRKGQAAPPASRS